MNKENNILAINPNNDKQARIFYCMFEAHDAKENRHPQKVMIELAIKHNFKILRCIPQSIADGWDFWIEFNKEPINLPSVFRKGIPWTEVGTH